jgi:hypothetical protein
MRAPARYSGAAEARVETLKIKRTRRTGILRSITGAPC